MACALATLDMYPSDWRRGSRRTRVAKLSSRLPLWRSKSEERFMSERTHLGERQSGLDNPLIFYLNPHLRTGALVI